MLKHIKKHFRYMMYKYQQNLRNFLQYILN